MSDHNDIFEYLLLNNAVEIAGIDSDTGEFLYMFTPKLKEVLPELYNLHMQKVNSEVMRLWEMGYVNIDLMRDDPIVTLSEKAIMLNGTDDLSEEDIWALKEIKRVLQSPEL